MRAALLALLFATAAGAQGYRPNVSLQLSYTTVQAQLLGQTLSVNDIQLTAANPNGIAVTLVGGGRLYLVAPAINGNGYIHWNPDVGVSTPAALEIGAGASFFADSIYSRQGDRSVSLDQAHGLRLSPQATIGTCDNTTGAGHHREGDVKTLAATGTSRTRTCTCTANSNSGPAFAWALSGGAGAVGTASACPEVTP